MDREVLHVDANKFYATCEACYRPELRNIPFVVGGDEEARHGIVLAANEHARSFGIKTAETLYSARKKCPNLLSVPARFKLYENFSKKLRVIYEQYTDQVQPFGLDECWLDVTRSLNLFGSGEKIAQEIRQRVKSELGLTVSIGVSWNKIFAKLGSDYKKPDAVTVITRENYKDIVRSLPASDLLGIGRSTKNSLEKIGIYTLGQLAKAPRKSLLNCLGINGGILQSFANGEDTSPVKTTEESYLVKTVGNSRTTPFDLTEEDGVRIVLYQMAESVAARLREGGYVCRTVQLSIRGNDMAWYQRQGPVSYPCQDSNMIYKTAYKLYCDNRSRIPIRNIGVRACNLLKEPAMQMSFLDDITAINKHTTAEYSINELRERYGHHIIWRGLMYTNPRLSRLSPKDEHKIFPVSFFR